VIADRFSLTPGYDCRERRRIGLLHRLQAPKVFEETTSRTLAYARYLRLARRPSRLTRHQLAFRAYNAYNECMQYTIRKVPDRLDEALRRAARERGKSLNEVAIEALARGAGITADRNRQRDLADIAGTWRKDPAFDSALAAQHKIDEEMWR
jgi:hypothetical protein